MTVQDFITWFGSNSNIVLSYYVVIILISLIGMLFVKPPNFRPPITYLYSMIVYAVTIPGLFALILLLYSFFFLRTNLLQVDLITYFVPILAMIITLVIVNKTVEMSKIPGFGKLSGLFVLIIVTFVITYVLQRMFFGVFFVGRIQHLVVFFLVLLFVLKIAWNRIVK
ncbi:hypothetical protein [Aquimarina pacifica]|uniref:hypothetical protein n=1 Tax=Aquimarina pacifica TaxID=1296415 RepID=UPI0004B745FC|nr:hypothetical protein [Aquimarina pacifica]